jgi:hypothetical protein
MTPGTPGTPSTFDALRALAAVTWMRLRRGKALWIGVVIAALPVVHAGLRSALDRSAAHNVPPGDLAASITPVLILLPALFVAASIADELESRTATYLWSRPLPRWAVLAGKLIALVPVIGALLVVSWLAATTVGGHAASPLSYLALVLGGAAVSLAGAAIATLTARHAMALTIAYMLADTFLGALPFSLAQISITYQVRVLGGLSDDAQAVAAPIIALALLSAIWGGLAVWRIGKREI